MDDGDRNYGEQLIPFLDVVLYVVFTIFFGGLAWLVLKG